MCTFYYKVIFALTHHSWMDGDVREEVDGIDLVLFFSDMLCFVQLKEGGHHIPAWYCILILNARVWEYHILV